MSRHRNIRGYEDDDFDDDYEEESFSFDESCVTPETANTYIYSRSERKPSLSKIVEDKPREEESYDDDFHTSEFTKHLNVADREKCEQCVDTLRDVLGGTIPDSELYSVAISHGFDSNKSLEFIMDSGSSTQKQVSFESLFGTAPPINQILDGQGHGSFNLADILQTDCGSSEKKEEAPLNLNQFTLDDVNFTLENILGETKTERSGFDLAQCLNTGNETTTEYDFLEDIGIDKIINEPNRHPKRISALSTCLDNLVKREKNFYGIIKNWCKQIFAEELYAFDELSPDDIFRQAKQGRLREKSQPPPKAAQVVPKPVVSLPPVETSTRLTFASLDEIESGNAPRKVVNEKPKNKKSFKENAVIDSPKSKKVSQDSSKALSSSRPDVVKSRNASPEVNDGSRDASPQDTSKDDSPPKTPSKPKIDAEELERQYDAERSQQKPLLNLVVVGHVDAGKSTLLGHLLYLTGTVNKKAIDKYAHESKKQGKSSFAFAWVLDEGTEERSRGITMDTAYATLESDHRLINILDAPGHKDFIPNMITGAAQADAAVLVVDATRGEFETGFLVGGQTREHTTLVRSLGVNQLVVAVNKLDTCKWSKERFNEIENRLRPFLRQTGFTDQSVSFVPCSGLLGENIHSRAKDADLCKWYSGPSVLEAVDQFKPPRRPITKPFRMSIGSSFKGVQTGFFLAGRIEAGSLGLGDKVLLMPAKEPCIIKGITIDDVSRQRAFAGDRIIVAVDRSIQPKMMNGSVLCDFDNPVCSVTKFEMQMVVMNVEMPIIKGSPVILHLHSVAEQANISKLVKELDKNTGQVIRERPRFLTKNSSGVVIVKTANPICVELYKDLKALGRVTLRQDGNTIAAGIVTNLL